MHYYKKNIGDYYKKAGRLSILQHGVYTLLIDACYDRECFPTFDEAMDWTWASTPEEVQAVEFVLKKFFTLEDGVYVQKRIKEELADYANQKAINSANGKKGGRPKKEQKDTDSEAKKTQSVLKETQPVNLETEKKPNQEPLTNNHKPRTTNQEPVKKDIAQVGDKLPAENPSGSPPASELDHNDQLFNQFWEVYPRKTDKAKAKLAFGKALKRASVQEISDGLYNQINSEQWQKKRFIPHPTTWLNGDRWEDEIIESEVIHHEARQSIGNSAVAQVERAYQQLEAEQRRAAERPVN